MNVSFFIARRIRFRGKLASVSIAVSFLVMILSVAISSGFRKEIGNGIASVAGDIMITPSNLNFLGGVSPIERNPAYLPYLDSIAGVRSVRPVVFRAGIIKCGDIIQGVLFKGTEHSDSSSAGNLSVSIPSSLAAVSGLSVGDDLYSYFVGEKVRARKFTVTSVYESILEADDKMIVYADLTALQRLNGWSEGQVSAFEVVTEHKYRNEKDLKELASEVGAVTLLYSSDDEESVVCTSAVSNYPQLFDWLQLIDFNVYFILLLMTVVAGFNMISGLLILLFENIPVIGTLKAVGMKDSAIAGVFLSASSVLILKGMAVGNILAVGLCLLQSSLHLIRLDPQNYFVSFVPVHLEPLKILAADAVAYLVIMLLLLLPSMFISRVDPAKTMRMK